MKLPLSWLKEYADFSLPAEKLAELLTLSGSKVEAVERDGGEAVLEIEVTTNRPDCLSLLGLAREVSVLTGKKIQEPRVPPSGARHGRRVSIRIEDKKACPFYTARVIEGVGVCVSPERVRRYLGLTGTRAIHNVVDATNWVLFEIGQPLHAFDLDKLRGGIVVRRARGGEKLLGLDGVEYPLDAETLVIADDSGPVAMAGVIGGKASEVTESTKNILLESAFFDPAVVRRSSRRYKISTESSYRFERRVDASRVDWASRRAAQLILEWSGGALTGAGSAGAAPAAKERVVRLRLSRLNGLLGIRVPAARALSILNALGFRAKLSAKDAIAATPPSFRRDVGQEADLVEEILRIEGFEKIAEALPATRYSAQHLKDRRDVLLKKEGLPEVKRHLASQGFQEIITVSLLSAKALSDASFDTERYAPNRIANAVSAEQAYLRPSLLPGALQTVVHNVHRKALDLKLFEMGKCHKPGRKNGAGTERPEHTCLGLLLYGQVEKNWRRKSQAGYSDLIGALEGLLHFLGRRQRAVLEPDAAGPPCTRYVNRARIRVAGQEVGFAAGVHPSVLKNWDIPHEVFFAELDLDRILEDLPAPAPVRATPLPKFPAVRRDIAFVVDRAVQVSELTRLIGEAGSPYLKEAVLFDEYAGKNIAADKRSLAFSLAYQKADGTFTDEEIQEVQSRVGLALRERFQAEIR